MGWSSTRAIAMMALPLVCIAATAPARALDQAEAQELLAMIAAGVKPQTVQLNDAAIQDYRHPQGEDGAHEFLVISRGDHSPIKLAAQHFTMKTLQVGGQGPNAIYVSYSGGDHCCYTVHLIWIVRELRYESIDLGASDLSIVGGHGAMRLRFQDPAFASWHRSEPGPGPTVQLKYDPETRHYVADADAMRKPPPDAAAFEQQAAAIRKTYAALPPGALDPSLWTAMLDLIYSGNADTARSLLDEAWPPDRPGEGDFLTDFSRQLWQGAIWRRFELGAALGAEAAFPPLDRGRK